MKLKRLIGILGAVAAVTAVSMLTSCSLSKSGVKLHTKKQMQEIADENHGPSTYVRQEAEGEDAITFYFTDDTYGFEYSYRSYKRSQGMDGSTFYYDLGLRDNWAEAYLEYITEKYRADFEAWDASAGEGIYVSVDDGKLYKINVPEDYAGGDDEMKSLCESLAVLIEKADEAGYYKDKEIAVFPEGIHARLCTYKLDTKEYIGRNDTKIADLKLYLELELQKGRGSAEYIKTVVVDDIKDVPGAQGVNIDGRRSRWGYPYEEDKIKLYYYEIEGEQYFVANFTVDNGNIYIAGADGSYPVFYLDKITTDQ